MQRREALGVLTVAAGSVLLPASLPAAAEQTPAPNNLPAERVTGIGGVFFRARSQGTRAVVSGQPWCHRSGVDSGSRADGVHPLCREDELLWRLDEAVDDQLPRGRSGQDGAAARGRGHRSEGGPHDIPKRRSLCTHSRSGREPNRVVAADENGQIRRSAGLPLALSGAMP